MQLEVNRWTTIVCHTKYRDSCSLSDQWSDHLAQAPVSRWGPKQMSGEKYKVLETVSCGHRVVFSRILSNPLTVFSSRTSSVKSCVLCT